MCKSVCKAPAKLSGDITIFHFAACAKMYCETKGAVSAVTVAYIDLSKGKSILTNKTEQFCLSAKVQCA